MPNRALLIATSTLAVMMVTETTALALQGGEDPALLPVLLDKRYGAKGTHKLTLMAGTSVATKLVEDVPIVVNYQYHFNDLLGVAFTGGFFIGSETSIGNAIRAKGVNPACDPSGDPNCEPLGDLYQMQWYAGVDGVFTPLYGKISFASEWNPSFHLYLIAGGGAGGVRRKQTADNNTAAIGHDSTVTFVGNLGVGLRLDILDWVGLRWEFRSFFYPEPAPGLSGMTFNPHIFGGVEFTLGRPD